MSCRVHLHVQLPDSWHHPSKLLHALKSLSLMNFHTVHHILYKSI